MAHSEIVIETWNVHPVIADQTGQSVGSSAFRVYGEKFTRDFIEAKYEFWYQQWDNIAGNWIDTLNMTEDEYHAELARTRRMMDAWRKRLIEYTVTDY